jgi:hypothetical protein
LPNQGLQQAQPPVTALLMWVPGKGRSMNALSLFTLLSIAAISPAVHAGSVTDHEIISSFLDCPEIVRAQEELSGPDTSADPAGIVLRNNHCGAVGCQSYVLVAQEFERHGVNPSLTNMLASAVSHPATSACRWRASKP